MKSPYRQSRSETLVYIALWVVMFTLPIVGLYLHTQSHDDAFRWIDVKRLWSPLLSLLVAFVIHNYLIAPLLVCKQKKVAYLAMVLVLVGVFELYQCNHHPGDMPPRGKPDFERVSPGHNDKRHNHHHTRRPPLPPRDNHNLVALFLLILSLGTNLGVKNYFRSRTDRQRLAALQRENLQQELEYLKYQVNPHFFMNTLNNIHALVDIDPEQAKCSIVKLSRLMRYVLYEGTKQNVQLRAGIEFLEHYIDLMRMRYTDKVDIRFNHPQDVPNVEVPPLLIVSLVENAFKHGVSYNHHSFIHITLDTEPGKLTFTCHNSKHNTEHEPGGIGLKNVIKRLDLLFPDRYEMKIDDQPQTYFISLTIPISQSL